MQPASFDEVAAAAVSKAIPLLVAVCPDLATVRDLEAWLQSAVPAFGPHLFRRLSSDALQNCPAPEAPTVFFVFDAGEGDDQALRSRWTRWDTLREQLLSVVRSGKSGSLVFPMTEARARDMANVSQNLMSVAATIRVSGATPQVETEPELRADYEAVVAGLEQKYKLATRDLVAALLARENTHVLAHDLARWQAAIQALGIASS